MRAGRLAAQHSAIIKCAKSRHTPTRSISVSMAEVALLLVLLVNAAGCAVALVRVLSLAPLLALPATRRHLTLRVTPETASESALHETSGELNYRVTTTP